MQISRQLEGSVALLTWDDGENRVNLDSLASLNEHLDDLEATSGPLAVVLTGVGKFFSNGLDLARFGSNPAELHATLDELCRTVGRLWCSRPTAWPRSTGTASPPGRSCRAALTIESCAPTAAIGA